jgi:hypothetical protein
MRDAETTLAIIRERGRHCHVAIHRGTLTNRLRDLINEGKLSPTGEWVLPSPEEPQSGKATRSQVRNGEKS